MSTFVEQDIIMKLKSEITRLRSILNEIASQCHNLPMSATAERIEKLARDSE